MAFESEADRVVRALGAVEGLDGVWRSYPEEPGDMELPYIVVEKADERGIDFRDGKEYLTEIEFYVRVFAPSPSQADAIAHEARLCLEEIGYRRVQEWEDLHAQPRQMVARYRKAVATEK